MALSLSAYILAALYSIIFSLRRLNRPGVSLEIRKMFQKKHTAYVSLFIVIWTIQLSSSYYHLFNPDSGELSPSQKLKAVDEISGFAMFSTGILLVIVRLYEPFFIFWMKTVIKMCFGIIPVSEVDGSINTETLSTFLASSLNIELVHIILKGIKKFSNEEKNYDSKRILTLNRIKIKNPDGLDGSKKGMKINNGVQNESNKNTKIGTKVEDILTIHEEVTITAY